MNDYETAHADGVKAEYERRMADIRNLQMLLEQEKRNSERLSSWLNQYREGLKKTNVFHQNQGIINEINKLIGS